MAEQHVHDPHECDEHEHHDHAPHECDEHEHHADEHEAAHAR